MSISTSFRRPGLSLSQAQIIRVSCRSSWPRPVRVRTCLPRLAGGSEPGRCGEARGLETLPRTRTGSTLPELSCKQSADRRHPHWVDPALLAQVALLAFNYREERRIRTSCTASQCRRLTSGRLAGRLGEELGEAAALLRLFSQ